MKNKMKHTPSFHQHQNWHALRLPMDWVEVSSSFLGEPKASAGEHSQEVVDSCPFQKIQTTLHQALTHIHQQREDSNTEFNHSQLSVSTCPYIKIKTTTEKLIN